MTRKHGELESAVLNCIWDLEEAGKLGITSADIQAELNSSVSVALTTLLTVLSRLCEKDLVSKVRVDGKSWAFSTTKTRTEYSVEALMRLVENSENPQLVLAHFAGSLSRTLRSSLQKSLDQRKK